MEMFSESIDYSGGGGEKQTSRGVVSAETNRSPYAQAPGSTSTVTQNPQPCWLLRLSTELLYKILYECTPTSQARMARTTRALHQISVTSLFRDVRLPEFKYGKSFRQACRINPERKNQMRSLEYPASSRWTDWLRWDSAMTNMPNLRHLYVTSCKLVRRSLLEAVSDIAPNICRLELLNYSDFGSSEPCFASFVKLRRLDLEDCCLDGNLKPFVRSIPALTSILVLTHDGLEPITETWLQNLACFRKLGTLHLIGPTHCQSSDQTSTNRIFEFPSLENLFIDETRERWGTLPVLELLALPKLRHLEVSINDWKELDTVASAFLSDRLPRLSLLRIWILSDEDEGPDLDVKSLTPLFRVLREAGFRFGFNYRDPDKKLKSWWEAKRPSPELEEAEASTVNNPDLAQSLN